MNVIEAMKAFGLNAKGAQRRLNEMQIAEESAASADTAKPADSANGKWDLLAEKLKTYNGRFTKEKYPFTVDLEKHLERDLTPDQAQAIWDKFKKENENE